MQPLKFAFAKLIFLLLLICGAIGQAITNSTSTSKTSTPTTLTPALAGNWRLLLLGQDLRDDFNQGSFFTLRADLNFTYKLSPWLILMTSPTFRSLSGHSQTDLGNENNTSNIFLRRASADFVLIDRTSLQVGLINQLEMHSPLLTDDRGFPAARLQVRSGTNFNWGAYLESGIPTSSSMTTNTKEFEPTPTFAAGGAQLNYKSSLLKIKNQIGLYEFKNLPQSVATASGLLGNTVIQTNNTDSSFVYEYKVLEAIAEIELGLSPRFSLQGYLTGSKNSAAPSGLNQGLLAIIGIDYKWTSTFAINPFLQYFRIEPDAAVAIYADNRLNTNRIGYKTGSKFEFAQKFNLLFAAGERGLVFDSATQSKERFYELGLETTYANF